MKRNCDACGVEYETESKASKFCKDAGCRRERARARQQKSRGFAPVTDLPVSQPADSVEAATVAELTAAGRLNSHAGRNAVVLAARLDAARSNTLETGASVASLSKQHLAAMAEATKNVSVRADGVDELKLRRERRGA